MDLFYCDSSVKLTRRDCCLMAGGELLNTGGRSPYLAGKEAMYSSAGGAGNSCIEPFACCLPCWRPVAGFDCLASFALPGWPSCMEGGSSVTERYARKGCLRTIGVVHRDCGVGAVIDACHQLGVLYVIIDIKIVHFMSCLLL
jgi:hypothetical protein